MAHARRWLKNMKALLPLLLVVAALAGCGKKQFRDAGAGNVLFAEADVSIGVGPGWLRIDAVPAGMCSPALAGQAGLIQAYWARPEFPNMEAIIAQAKTGALGESAEDKEFRSDAGVQGRYCSMAKTPTKPGAPETRVTKIVVPTRSGRLLILDLIGPNDATHQTTREAIIRTLAYAQK
jgi:hypothetical protein